MIFLLENTHFITERLSLDKSCAASLSLKGCEGTIISKALDALESGEGLILVLVMTI